MDEHYHIAGNKGQAKHRGKNPLRRRTGRSRKKRDLGRGHDDKDGPAVIAWVSRPETVVIHRLMTV